LAFGIHSVTISPFLKATEGRFLSDFQTIRCATWALFSLTSCSKGVSSFQPARRGRASKAGSILLVSKGVLSGLENKPPAMVDSIRSSWGKWFSSGSLI
jgi:hypothetical protein